jgi:hypothetical protein
LGNAEIVLLKERRSGAVEIEVEFVD